MPKILILTIIVGLISAATIAQLEGESAAASFSAGFYFLTLNLIILTLSWWLILRKKLIAISFPIIVFKYALLAAILYPLLRIINLDRLWLIAGFALFFISLTTISIVFLLKNKRGP